MKILTDIMRFLLAKRRKDRWEIRATLRKYLALRLFGVDLKALQFYWNGYRTSVAAQCAEVERQVEFAMYLDSKMPVDDLVRRLRGGCDDVQRKALGQALMCGISEIEHNFPRAAAMQNARAWARYALGEPFEFHPCSDRMKQAYRL